MQATALQTLALAPLCFDSSFWFRQTIPDEAAKASISQTCQASTFSLACIPRTPCHLLLSPSEFACEVTLNETLTFQGTRDVALEVLAMQALIAHRANLCNQQVCRVGLWGPLFERFFWAVSVAPLLSSRQTRKHVGPQGGGLHTKGGYQQEAGSSVLFEHCSAKGTLAVEDVHKLKRCLPCLGFRKGLQEVGSSVGAPWQWRIFMSFTVSGCPLDGKSGLIPKLP